MTIITGINNSLLKPQTFHTISYLKAGRSLVSLPQRGLLVGVAKGTAVANTIVQIDDPTTTDTMFGIGTPLALMCRKAFATAAFLTQGPALFACPLAEGATAQTATLTLTGAATADGNATVRVAGRYITVGVTNGASITTIAAALNTEIQKIYQDIWYTSAPAVGVITLTATAKGTHANDTIFDVVTMPTGIAATWAQVVAGATAVDIQPALDAMAGQDYDGVAVMTHLAADVVKINTTLVTRFGAAEKKPSWFFIGEPGSIGTATGLAANHEGIVIGSWEQSRSLPCEIATALMMGALSKNRPNANYDGMILPLYPPPIAYDYTNAEIETALNAGLTPLSDVIDPTARTVIDGQGKVQRMVTTRTTSNSLPFVLLRDLGVSRTAWAMARQYDLRYAQQFGPDANPDGVLLDDDTSLLLKDMIIDINKAAEDLKWLRDVDDDITTLALEPDATTSGRINVDVPYTIVVGLHQVAFVHRAQI